MQKSAIALQAENNAALRAEIEELDAILCEWENGNYPVAAPPTAKSRRRLNCQGPL